MERFIRFLPACCPLLVVLALTTHIALGEQTFDKMLESGENAFSNGDYKLAESQFQTARQLLPADLNAASAAEARVDSDLAAVDQALGKYQEAETLLRHSAELNRNCFGTDSVQAAATLGRIASLLADEGKYQQALDCAAKALAIQQEHDPASVPATLRTMGNVLVSEGLYRQAKKLHLEVLRLDQSNGAANLALDRSILARDAYKAGDLMEAEELFRQALQEYNSAGNKKQAEFAIALNNFGQVELALGRRKQAIAHYREAIEIWKRALGSDHPNVASGLSNLAAALLAERQYAKADKLYREALAIDQAKVGINSPQVARDLNNLAFICLRTHKLDQAETILDRSLAVSSKAGAAANADAAIQSLNLAYTYVDRKQFGQAEPWFQKAVAVLDETWGPDNPKLAPILERYAAALRADAKYAEAERIEVTATRVRVSVALNQSRQADSTRRN